MIAHDADPLKLMRVFGELAMEIEPFVDATKAAEFLHLRPRRVLELARRGLIPAYPLGNGRRRVWRFRLAELASALGSYAVNSAHAAVRTGKGTN